MRWKYSIQQIMLEMYDVTYTDYKWKEKQEKKKALKNIKENETLNQSTELIMENMRKAFKVKEESTNDNKVIPLKNIL